MNDFDEARLAGIDGHAEAGSGERLIESGEGVLGVVAHRDRRRLLCCRQRPPAVGVRAVLAGSAVPAGSLEPLAEQRPHIGVGPRLVAGKRQPAGGQPLAACFAQRAQPARPAVLGIEAACAPDQFRGPGARLLAYGHAGSTAGSTDSFSQ